MRCLSARTESGLASLYLRSTAIRRSDMRSGPKIDSDRRLRQYPLSIAAGLWIFAKLKQTPVANRPTGSLRSFEPAMWISADEPFRDALGKKIENRNTDRRRAHATQKGSDTRETVDAARL